MTRRVLGFSAPAFTGPLAEKSWPWVLDQSGAEDPLVCLLATAGGDDARTIVLWHEAMMMRGIRSTHVPLIRSLGPERTRETLLSADVIYVGGGNTAALLSIWSQHHLGELLGEAADDGALMAGHSAGMICWFQDYVTDSFGDIDPMHDGLGWAPGAACTHWDSEPRRRVRLPELVVGGFPTTLVVEDGTAVVIQDGRVTEAVTAVVGKRAFVLRKSGDATVEDDLAVRSL